MVKQRNTDIRTRAKERGVCLWEIAEALGLSDANFSRTLRRELPEVEKQKILQIIESLEGGEDA